MAAKNQGRRDIPCVLYAFWNKVNDKSYVGVTTRVKERYKEHVRRAFGRNPVNEKLPNALRKHGLENIEFEVICEYPSEDMAREAECLAWLGGMGQYNEKEPGGGRLVAQSENTKKKMRGPRKPHGPMPQETRDKISAAKKGKPTGKSPSQETRDHLSKLFTGRKHTPEVCALIGDAHRGKNVSKETREKQSKAKLGVKRDAEFCEKIRIASTGRLHTEESKQKMSRVQKGHKVSDAARAKMSASHTGRKDPPEVIEVRRKAAAEAFARRRIRQNFDMLLAVFGPKPGPGIIMPDDLKK